MQAITSSAQPSPTAPADVSDLARDLYALVLFVHKDCTADLFAAFSTLELSISQVKLLHQLDEQDEPITLKAAGELIGVSLPTASRIVEGLLRRGFVERHEDTHDRRMKRVSVTAYGRTIVRKLNAARLNGFERFAHTLNETERSALAAVLQQLTARDEIAACRPEDTL